MSVTEVRQALGSWQLSLDANTPADVLDALTPFGHLVIVPGRMTSGDIQATGDALLTAARYVGVLRGREAGGEAGRAVLKGAGMAFWLGDEDGKGYVYESTLTASGTFSSTVSQLLAPVLSVSTGVLTAVPGDGGAFTSRHIYVSPREALTYVTDSFSSSTVPVGWRVNGDGTVDAGPESALYRTTPVAMLVAKDDDEGRDLAIVGMRGNLELESDLTDYTTRVVLLAEGEENATATGSATLGAVPYKDIRGNTVKFTRLVSEDQTSSGNATVRAQLQLNRFSGPRYAVTLDTSQYDVKGEFVVGDTIMIFDPAVGFIDLAREQVYRGLVINPMFVQVTEMTWPVQEDWTVAYRDGNGVWTDLSAYYVPEGGATTVVVGQFSRDILANSFQQVGSRPLPDASIPATPAFSASATSAYLSELDGSSDTKAVIQLTWNTPLNSDGSTVVDGDHYTLRYRPVTITPYSATHLQMASKHHDQLLTHQQPLIPAIVDTNWHLVFVPWGTNTALVSELTPGVRYEFQVQATDGASPPNSSAFSASWIVPAALDNLAPAQPAAPEVAGSQVSIQVVHRLGANSGGTFNLDADLDHLEVHVSGDPAFAPDDSTRVGKLMANVALMRAGIPVVGTFPIPQVDGVQVKVVAVDRTGNRSAASPAAGVTVVLIDNAHISDLTASKITAGSFTATYGVVGTLQTAESGARALMSATGFYTYDPSGVNTFLADTSGNVSIVGELTTSATGRRIRVNPSGGEGQIRFYSSDNGDFSLIDTRSYYGGAESGIFIRSSLDANDNYFGTLYSTGHWRSGYLKTDFGASGGLYYADRSNIRAGGFPNDIQQSGIYADGGGTFIAGTWVDNSNQKAALQTFDSGGTSVARLAVWDDTGATVQAGITMSEDDYFVFTGRLHDSTVTSLGSDDLFMPGAFATTAGTSFTMTYGPTMVVAPRPFYYVRQNSGTNFNHKLTVYSTTSFTVQISTSLAIEIGWLSTIIIN